VRSVLAALSSLFLTALVAEGAAQPAQASWGVGLYLAGESDLWQTAHYLASAAQKKAAGLALAVLEDGPLGGHGGRFYIAGTLGGPRVQSWGPLNTGSPAVLARFVAQLRRQARARYWALVILGHGRPVMAEPGPWGLRVSAAGAEDGKGAARSTPPFLPDLLSGGLAEDWGAGRDCLTPHDLQSALAGSCWDVVVLAACYSATAEYAASLSSCARWMVATPGQLALSGEGVLGFITRLGQLKSALTPAQAAAMAVEALAEDARAAESGHLVVAVDLTQMPMMVETVRLAANDLRLDASGSLIALEAARPGVPRWGPRGELADLAALAARWAQMLPASPARQALASVAARAGAMVACRVGDREGAWSQAGGLAVFLPSFVNGMWNDYEQVAPFASSSGWGSLLRDLRQAALAIWSEGLHRQGAEGCDGEAERCPK
jgi:hypothetical protein